MWRLRYWNDYNLLPYWLTERKLYGKLYYWLNPTAPRHGVDCSCNCGNWRET